MSGASHGSSASRGGEITPIDKEMKSTIAEAEAGDASAQFALATAYRTGRTVPHNLEAALRWYLAAAEQSHAKAQNDLGSMYLNGMGTARNAEEAVRWYRAAADQGESDAMFNLGTRYRSGTGVAQDYAEAFAWFEQGANAGSKEAMCEVGTAYRFGNGMPKNLEVAAYWHLDAADLGDEVALGNLADYREELEALALNENPAAAHHLARMYEGGLGVEKDNALMYAWVRWGWRNRLGPFDDDDRINFGPWLSDLRCFLPLEDRQRGLVAFKRLRSVQDAFRRDWSETMPRYAMQPMSPGYTILRMAGGRDSQYGATDE